MVENICYLDQWSFYEIPYLEMLWNLETINYSVVAGDLMVSVFGAGLCWRFLSVITDFLLYWSLVRYWIIMQ